MEVSHGQPFEIEVYTRYPQGWMSMEHHGVFEDVRTGHADSQDWCKGKPTRTAVCLEFVSLRSYRFPFKHFVSINWCYCPVAILLFVILYSTIYILVG